MTDLFTTLGYELVAVVYLIFSIFVLLRSARSRVAFFFVFALLLTAVWAQLASLVYHGLLPEWLFAFSATARDSGWLAFGLTLMYSRTDVKYWGWTVAGAAALLLLQFVFYSSSTALGTIAGVRIDAPLIRVGTTLLGLIVTENVLRNASRAEFWTLKHWAIGFASISVFQLAIRIPEFLTHIYDPNIELANPLIFLITLPLFVITSIRLPQLQLRVHSSRTFVFHTTTLIGVGVIMQGTAFAAWYVRTYGGNNGTALALTIVFSGIVGVTAAAASGTIRSRIRLIINRNFFTLKYDYRVEWEKAIRSLIASPEKNVAERALRILCDLMDTSGGAIWLYQESWRQFKLAGKLGASVQVMTLALNDERVELLRHDDRPFVQFDGKGKPDARFGAFQTFVDSGWIVVPLRYRTALVGFMVLNKPRATRDLDWEDESLMRVLAMQVTAYLIQEETAQSLADARQLEDFNKRFAFVVHDIKNTIGQLSLLVRNIAQFGDQKEFRDDMVITLGNSVDRLQVLLKSLTAVGETPIGAGGVMQPVNIAVLLSDFVAKKKQLGYNINLKGAEREMAATTDSVALLRVIEHVVSNAFEASNPDDTVEIVLSDIGDLFQIVVADRGAGMTQQFIDEELFRPMRSTKSGGFGVGGYQIRELIREVGGDVNVESVVGHGTRVILTLPNKQTSITS
jgi:putative PEP-CTERM system histidine kinase